MDRILNTCERTLRSAAEADQRALEAVCRGHSQEASRARGEASLLRFKARLMD